MTSNYDQFFSEFNDMYAKILALIVCLFCINTCLILCLIRLWYHVSAQDEENGDGNEHELEVMDTRSQASWMSILPRHPQASSVLTLPRYTPRDPQILIPGRILNDVPPPPYTHTIRAG